MAGSRQKYLIGGLDNGNANVDALHSFLTDVVCCCCNANIATYYLVSKCCLSVVQVWTTSFSEVSTNGIEYN